MLVKSLMIAPLENMLVLPTANLQEIINSNAMIQGGCILVCQEKQLLGILTDGDLRRHLKHYSDNCAVSQAMTPSPKSIQVDSLVSDAFRLMTELKINQLPVVNKALQVVGFLDYHSVANIMSPEQLFIDLTVSKLTENENRHLARYRFATQFLEAGGDVLDCACGSGYGSKLLMDNGLNVTGVDLCQKAITHAQEKYTSQSGQFLCQDIDQLNFADESFDAVITLETLEHVSNDTCHKFLGKISQYIKPGGIVIASSPMLRYKNGEPYITNPYHINELPKSELLAMFKTRLTNFELHFYHQKETKFLPLVDENSGFCILVGRKKC